MPLRWDASQRLWKDIIKKLYEDAKADPDAPLGEVPQYLIDIYESVLKDEDEDGQLRALILELPSKEGMVNELHDVDTELLEKVIKHFNKEMGTSLQVTIWKYLMENVVKGNASYMHGSLTTNAPADETYKFIPSQVSKRAMEEICLSYLAATEKPVYSIMLAELLNEEQNMELMNEETNMANEDILFHAANQLPCSPKEFNNLRELLKGHKISHNSLAVTMTKRRKA